MKYRALALAGTKPLARGTWKLVFQHPHADGLLVKVLRTDDKARRPNNAWYKKLRRERNLLPFSRELHEFIVAQANDTGRPSPIPRVDGIVETDLGFGLVVEKLTGRDGRLAPRLKEQVFGEGFTPAYQTMVKELVDEIDRRRIVLSELKPNNILVVATEGGGERVVLVDGAGEAAFVPIYSLSRSANRWRNSRLYRKLLVRCKEIADRGRQSFDSQPAGT